MAGIDGQATRESTLEDMVERVRRLSKDLQDTLARITGGLDEKDSGRAIAVNKLVAMRDSLTETATRLELLNVVLKQEVVDKLMAPSPTPTEVGGSRR